ncbi:MAG: hypothetical protein NTY68_01345 [Candidatus Micrarchaeota archaeon]|nr:hypothetical protein [Candidatus Micrarchaeota archaeon]
MRKTVFLIVLALVLSFGCIGNMIGQSTGQYLNQSMTVTDIQDNSTEVNANTKNGSCYLFICQNQTKTTLGGWLKKYFYYSWRYWEFFDPSLIGGSCWLQNVTLENREEIFANWSEGIYNPREVGIGQGLTFADFNTANLYCNNSLRYSLKLVRTMGSPSYLFSPKAYAGAACFLDKSVIPIYILYNNGTVPDLGNDNSGLFASKMNGTGPVMIASELNPSSEDSNIEKIESQIVLMKANCPNCLIGASIPLNDTLLLNKSKEDGILDKIDFVGFGIDSNYMDGTCGDALSLLSQAEATSFFVEKQFDKPTFWYYVNLNRTQCRWTDYEERKLYSTMFQDIKPMSLRGLMGMAPVSFYDSAFIYPDSNNSFLVSTSSGDQLRQDSFSSWFSFCRQYYGNQNYQIMTLDSSDLDTACSQNLVGGIPSKQIQYFGNAGDFVPLESINIDDKEKQMYQCKTCFIALDPKKTPDFIKNLDKNTFNGDNCSVNSEDMEFYADLYDIDSNLLRAFAARESGFNPCAISNISADIAVHRCTGIRLTKEPLEQALEQAGCDYNSVKAVSYDESFCALGMMQTTDLPGYMYNDAAYGNLDMPPEVKACGGSSFNPFNSTHSICAASYKIVMPNSYLANAYYAVSTHKDIFVVPGVGSSDENNSNLQDALVVTFTAAGYHGDSITSFVSDYADYAKNFNSNGGEISCGGMTQIGRELCCTTNKKGDLVYNNDPYVVCKTELDAVTFYNKVKSKYPVVMNYSLNVLGSYVSAVDVCGGCTKDEWFKNTCAKISLYTKNLPDACK